MLKMFPAPRLVIPTMHTLPIFRIFISKNKTPLPPENLTGGALPSIARDYFLEIRKMLPAPWMVMPRIKRLPIFRILISKNKKTLPPESLTGGALP
jgi:hypothetical protein